MGARGRAIIHEHLRELIVDDVRKAVQNRRKSAGHPPPELLAQYVASTFVVVLHWWVESNSALCPEKSTAFSCADRYDAVRRLELRADAKTTSQIG
jgi:hypothetical protein